MNNPTVSIPDKANNHADNCGPVDGIRKIRNITSIAPMMQLSNVVNYNNKKSRA